MNRLEKADSSLVILPKLRAPITLDTGNIGAIAWQQPPFQLTGRQGRAVRPPDVTRRIDPAQAGILIEKFARFVGIVDLALEFDFFVTAPAAAAAASFPCAMLTHNFCLTSKFGQKLSKNTDLPLTANLLF